MTSLRDLAAAWEAKYGEEWHFDVAGGAFQHSEGEAHVFSITPVKAYAYERDEPVAPPATAFEHPGRRSQLRPCALGYGRHGRREPERRDRTQ